jgi:hypothetical protein
MQKLFQISRIGSSSRWRVLLKDQPYGEYLDKDNAVIDAIEAATEARETGHIVEVWEGSVRVY